MPQSLSTDSGLLRSVQANDAAAWRQFVELYGPLIYAWCRRFGLSRDDAADLTQDSLIAVLRSVAAFDHAGGVGSLRGWLWTVTANKMRDYSRRRSPGCRGQGGSDARQQLEQLAFEMPSADSDPSSEGQTQALLQRCLEQVQRDVEPHVWQAFSLTVLDGRDTASVAAELQMSANYVRQAKSRVLRRLRDLME